MWRRPVLAWWVLRDVERGVRRGDAGVRVSARAGQSRKSEFVVAVGIQGGRFLVLGDAPFEEVLLLLDVHHLGEPRKWVLDAAVQRSQAAAFEATVRDEINVGDKFGFAQADGIDRQAVADELLLERHGFRHRRPELFLELGRPDLAVLLDEVHEQIPEHLDVVRLVAERVTEHLADAGKLVLAVKRQHHAEKAIELRSFHTLTEEEDVFREQLLVLRLRQIEVAAEIAGVADYKFVLPGDRRDILEHGLALVRVDAERRNHVQQRVGVDVLLMRMPAEHELQLGSGHHLAHDVLDVVAHNALGRRKVANAHPDDPAFDVGDHLLVAPLLDILAHRDVLGLPVIRLHLAIKVVGPLILKREEIEGHGLASVDDLLGGKGFFRLCLVEDECLGADLKRFLHETERRRDEETVREGRVRGATKSRENRRTGEVFRREGAWGDLKLLELIDRLLTTTGSGPVP